MVVIILVNLLSVFLSNLGKYKNFKNGLLLSVLVIFIFLALRFELGNDYNNYRETYNQISLYGIVKKDDHLEIGWKYLNIFFSYFGFDFFSFIIFLSLINNIFLYKIIKYNVDKRYYWLSIFIYTCTPSLMLIHLSAIRQLSAIFLMLIAIFFLFKEGYLKYILFLLLTYLAYTIHNSGFFIIIFIIIYKLINLFNTKRLFIFTVIYIFLFVFTDIITQYINKITETYFEKYTIYLENGGKELGSGLGFSLNLILLLILITSYDKIQEKKEKFIILSSIFSILVSFISMKLSMFSRLNLYLLPFMIVSYPLVINKVNNNLIKIIFISIVSILTIYNFYNFFYSPEFSKSYNTYKTIFSL